MKIDEFCTRFGAGARTAKDVFGQWQLQELDGLLRTLQSQHDEFIGGAVVVGDALHGGSLLDPIPPELKKAFVGLMHKKASTYGEMRNILLDHMRAEGGGFLPFDDRRVVGFVSKLKGQIGENLFKEHIGSAAVLADSGSQEAWDVAVRQASGAHEYVQVKLYGDAHGVVRHMLSVQEKVAHGLITGHAGEIVEHIDFAVPADIVERVNELKDHYPQLETMHVLTIPIDARSAAAIVTDGMSNVGPEQLNHFFDELLFGALAAGSLHAVVNGFLWYKGSKEFARAFADAAASTALSTTGIGIGLVAETLCHGVLLSSAVGISGRLVLSRLARSRWNFADFLETSVAATEARIRGLACEPQHAI